MAVTISGISFLQAMRQLQLHDYKGIIVPVESEEGRRFTLARSSDALSERVREHAKRCMQEAVETIQAHLGLYEEVALETILAGAPKESFAKVFADLAKKAEANLAVISHYRERIEGQEGAKAFLEQLIACNPGSFFLTYEQRQRVAKKSQEILVQYLHETKKKREELTLEDAQELNRRVQEAFREESFQLIPDRKGVGQEFLARYLQKKPFTAYHAYKADLAGRLFPTLEVLVEQGKITEGCPICIVQPGNNDIRNTMHVAIVKDLVHEFLEQKGLVGKVPIEVHILGLGGHPTTAAFVAHIEVMTAQERCEHLKQQDPQIVLPVILQTATKLEGAVQAQVQETVKLPYEKALDELLRLDSTRPIFAKLGNSILADPPIHLFKGVSEAETHGSYMQMSGPQDIYTLKLEPHSKHTGENVEFFVRKIPEGKQPVILLFDACRVGRQVVTFSQQMVEKSGKKEQNWSAIVSPLLDLPLSQYTKASTEEQLYIDVAALFAELARNIAYRTVYQYVDAVPIDLRGYQLLASYYAKMQGRTLEEAMQTPITVIMSAVGQEFADFENTIPAEHDIKEHPKELRAMYLRQQARRVLTHPDTEHFRRLIEESVKSGKKQPLRIRRANVPRRIVLKAHRKGLLGRVKQD